MLINVYFLDQLCYWFAKEHEEPSLPVWGSQCDAKVT